AGAGSFQRCNTGQGGKLGFTKAWPRRSKLGNQGCRCQWTQASDGLERGEPPRDSALELAVELLLLVCQQRQLCGQPAEPPVRGGGQGYPGQARCRPGMRGCLSW